MNCHPKSCPPWLHANPPPPLTLQQWINISILLTVLLLFRSITLWNTQTLHFFVILLRYMTFNLLALLSPQREHTYFFFSLLFCFFHSAVSLLPLSLKHSLGWLKKSRKENQEERNKRERKKKVSSLQLLAIYFSSFLYHTRTCLPNPCFLLLPL